MRFLRTISAATIALVIATPADAQGDQPRPAAGRFSSLPSALSDADTRLTTGVESLSRSATKGTQHLLIDLMLTAPLIGKPITRATKPLLSVWFNARFNGAPNASISGVKQFVGGFEDELVSGDVSSLLTALTFRTGFELQIGNGKTFQDHYQFQPTFIGAFGMATVPPLDAPVVFQLSDQARAHWNVPERASDKDGTPIKYIALTEPDRRRFYERWELGLRFKTHHFDNCDSAIAGCEPDARLNFPGIIDLTVGRDASVTGGAMRGLVYGIDAFYPLPTDSIANAVYLFGRLRAQRGTGINAEPDPIILRAPDATVALPSNEVFQHTLNPDERTRDDWKFGLGVDLIRLFTSAASGRKVDEAAAIKEDGFSRRSVLEHDELSIVRVLAQPGESAKFVHGTDFFVPITDGRVEVRPPSGDAITVKTFAKDMVDPAIAIKQRYKNIGDANFETLLMRLKPVEAKSDELKQLGLTNATAMKLAGDSRYVITRVACKAGCDVSVAKQVDNLVVIVPLTAGLAIAGIEKAEWKPYQPVVLPRKHDKDLNIKGDSGDFLVVRLR